jgi:hypothetical protein
MVYDEGFDFHFGEVNTKDFATYFIFSKYGMNDFKSFPGITTKWVSYCEATLIGWFQVGDNWGCFMGSKRGGDPNKPTNGEATNKQVVVEGSMTNKVFLQTFEKPKEEIRFMQSKFGEKLHLTSSFKDHAKFVTRINASQDATWKAAVYEEFEGKTIEQLNRIAGRRKSKSSPSADFHFKETETETETETVIVTENSSVLDSSTNELFGQTVFDKLNAETETIAKTVSETDFNSLRNKRARKNKFRFTNTKTSIESKKSSAKVKKTSAENKDILPEKFSWKKYIGAAKSQVRNIIPNHI